VDNCSGSGIEDGCTSIVAKISGGHEGSVEQFIWKNVNLGREVWCIKICGRVGMYYFAIG
jgi:hypothetical protein